MCRSAPAGRDERVRRYLARVWQDPPTKAELLGAWRDAIRGAELAERLAEAATDVARQADARAQASTEIAELAEVAAAAAGRAAERARAAANEAAELARGLRGQEPAAHAAAATARRSEDTAEAAYKLVEDDAHRAQVDGLDPRSDGESGWPSAKP